MDTPVKTDKLIARKENGIGWVIFNNPEKRNAMSLEMSEATAAAMESYAKDPEVRVVILRGEGGKAFVSGADISQFKERRSMTWMLASAAWKGSWKTSGTEWIRPPARMPGRR